MPFLLALFAAVAAMPTNVYQVCAWNVGTLEVEPWRARRAPIAAACRRLHSWWSGLWRLEVLAAAVLVVAVLAGDLSPHRDGVVLAVSGVFAIARPKLVAELEEAKKQAAVVMTTAEKEERELTAEERKSVQQHLDEAKKIKARLDGIDGDAEMRRQIDALTAGADKTTRPGAEMERQTHRALSLGQHFVASQVYEAIKAGNHRRQGFSAAVEIADIGATTLDESAGSGGKLVLPDYQQGIQPLLLRPIRVTQLLAPGTTDSNTVEYMVETTFTNAAAARAEAAAAAESTLVFDRVAEPVRSIAHFLPVTAEMLEDQAQTQSYIDGRLRLGLDLAEEDQLLNGSGVAPNLTGLMNRANLAAAVARGTDTNADAIFKQIIAIMTTAFVMPDGLVLNPTNWQTIVLGKDAQGQYYGNGPFSAMQTPMLWGLPAAVTPLIVANTSLVGAYRQCAQRFARRGATVTATNSHSDFFTKRLVAIMAEMREALAVYRPGAFGKVTGLN
jgi:HK97 family phage major capsid protein